MYYSILLFFKDLSWNQLKGDISVLLPCSARLLSTVFFGVLAWFGKELKNYFYAII
jgi:hypothetical protein